MPTYAQIIGFCAFLLIAKTGDVAGQDCPSPSSPAVLTAASGTIKIAPDITNANCAWRITAGASGTVSVTLTGQKNPATDVIKMYDGYDATASQLFSTSYISANSISVQQQSTQRYFYVTYTSTTSYGNYSLAYTSTGTTTASSGGSSALPNVSSAGGIICATLLLLLTLTRGTAISQFNEAKRA